MKQLKGPGGFANQFKKVQYFEDLKKEFLGVVTISLVTFFRAS